jgi:hypothetical protein
MSLFEDMEDVEEWLEPLGYEAFWSGIEPFGLAVQSRASCDEQIARGGIDQATVLDVLKGIARLELVERYQLKPRHPFARLYRH